LVEPRRGSYGKRENGSFYDEELHLRQVGGHLSTEMAGVTSDWIINDLSKKLNIKKAALMIESAVWTRPIAEIWANNIKGAGIEISVFEYFDVDTKDFTPILTKILKSKAEVICMLISHVDAATFINQWHDMKGPIMAGITASTSVIWGASKGKVLSVVELGGRIPGGLTPKSLPLQDAYRKRFERELAYTAPYQYDVMYMIKAAFEKAKSTDPEPFVKAMEEMDYVGAAGRWLYDKKTHHSKFGPGYRQFFMSQWQLSQGKTEGELCVIWPPNLKQCDWIMPPWYKK